MRVEMIHERNVERFKITEFQCWYTKKKFHIKYKKIE